MTDEELRDLQERVSLIETMTETQGWGLLIDLATDVLGPKQMRIVQGKCPSLEDYRADCAFIDGAKYVFGLPARLSQRLEDMLALRQEEEEAAKDELVFADEGG